MSIQVDEKLLQGNYAEHFVSHVLSSSCLVRPVVGQSDVGVDLYCESIIDKQLFLHFWVQVKSSIDYPNTRIKVSHAFRVPSLQYWYRQPVPVLAFLVPAIVVFDRHPDDGADTREGEKHRGDQRPVPLVHDGGVGDTFEEGASFFGG